MKIELDKYYTPVVEAKRLIDKTFDIIGNVSETIEPSAGNGSFSLQIENCISFDIEPEHESITKQDYLKLNIEHKKDRLIIGNPPFGRCFYLAQKFFKKSIEIADYIAFVLPIKQLNNTESLYQFDLIYSEDLGILDYSGIKLHCCFNIYKRPSNGKLNVKVSNKLKDITIIRQDSKTYNDIKEDIRICYWGNGSAGKVLKDGENYSGEYKIIINNQNLKPLIIELLNKVDWKQELNKIAMLKIQQFDIHNVLRKYIKGIK